MRVPRAVVSGVLACTMALALVAAPVASTGAAPDPADIVAISAGDWHSVGLKADGTCVAVGDNSLGQCEVTSWTGVKAIEAGGNHTIALMPNRTCRMVGGDTVHRQTVEDWTEIVAVSAGAEHTVGLFDDNTCVAAGDNTSGQCDVSGWSEVVLVAAGGEHTVGLLSNGSCVATGNNLDGQCNVTEWSGIAAVACGNGHTVGLRPNGTCVATGGNLDGQCNVTGWSGIKSISAGAAHTVGLKADGTCVAVGDNTYGQCDVSGWYGIVAIAAGGEHTIGLKADGTCVATGLNDSGACNVGDWGVFGPVSGFMDISKKLLAPDGASEDFFGRSVSIWGDYAVVGAWEDDNTAADAGAAYVFVRVGQSWLPYQKLTASDGAATDEFGCSVALSGNTIFVGAPWDDNAGGADAGAVYVFELSGTQWVEQTKLTAGAGAAASDNFGWSVAVSGNHAVIGMPRDDNEAGTDAGSAQILIRSGTSWTSAGWFGPDVGSSGDRLGYSVAISGDTALVGAPYDDNYATDAGCVYFAGIYGGGGVVKAGGSDSAAGDNFGFSVALANGTALIGAPHADAGLSNAGAAYVFADSVAGWAEQTKLTKPGGGAVDDRLGSSVAAGEGVLAVGAPGADMGPGSADAGRAYAFTRGSMQEPWILAMAMFAADGEAYENFGSSVAVSGATALVGAPSDDDMGVGSGSAYVFRAPVALAPVYRFYRPSSGTHFYTPNEAEKASVIANLSHIYKYEGVAYSVNPVNNIQLLYRFYNKRNGSHFYTASEAEKANVIANLSAIYSYDGPTYKVSVAAAPGKPPVYRFYNKRNGSHFYTASEAEKASVIANLSGIYTYEGIAFWLGQ